MIKGIIFDLDGTLLSTDKDLCKAINQMRAHFDLKPLHIELIKSYLGDGIRMLVTRALFDYDNNHLDQAISLFHDYYALCYNDETQAYDHVKDILKKLLTDGYRISIVSNKAQIYVDQLVLFHFPDIPFDLVYGDSDQHKRKPHPQGIQEALIAMNCRADEVILVGDSTVDIETAQESKIHICPVAWGFQPAHLLFEKSKVIPIKSIKEIYLFIESLRYN